MRLIFAILAVAFVLLQYRLWVSDDGLPAAWQIARSVDAQQAVNANLKARNDRLEAEVDNLKRGYEAVESRARSELGMVGESETFVQVVPEDAGGN